MENPGKLLQRARLNQRLSGLFKIPESEDGASPAPPVHRSNHASYTALMHSHDRMRTRHIAGKPEKAPHRMGT